MRRSSGRKTSSDALSVNEKKQGLLVRLGIEISPENRPTVFVPVSNTSPFAEPLNRSKKMAKRGKTESYLNRSSTVKSDASDESSKGQKSSKVKPPMDKIR